MDSLVTPSIESMRPYQAGKPLEELERELGIKEAVKLASNESPLGPSPKVLAALGQALPQVFRYPDAAAYTLRQELAAFHGASMDEVICGAGSNELLDLLFRTFTTREHHVVFAEPSFVVYRSSALAQGVSMTAVPLVGDVHDLEAMASSVTSKTRLLFVANPNNPTGTIVPKAKLEHFLKTVPEQVMVVMDEAYFEYADSPEYTDTSKLRYLRERLFVLRTFSKIYGLASLRVGYALGPKPLIEYMNRVRAPFNVSHLAQLAARVALSDQAHVETSRALNSRERQRLTERLAALGLRVTPSQANFVWVDTGRDASQVYQGLLEKGVIVRPFGAYPKHLRITVGTVAENDRLLEALAQVLQ